MITNKHVIPVFSLPVLLLLGALPLLARENDEQQDYQHLLDLLSQQTTIATQTRLNVDYVPGMVSIMTGDEMLDRGFATLWDALEYIPGIQKNIDATGKRNLIVRGVGKKTETSKIKILLNDVPVNASTGASLGMILGIPIEQIERVEFVRGPGSAIHGEFAMMGVLNVITYRRGKLVSAGIDSQGGGQVHLLQDWVQPDNRFAAGFNLSITRQAGEDVIVSQDGTPATINGYSPGEINNKRDSLSAVANLRLRDYSLNLQFIESNRGDHFGIDNFLPPPPKQTVISDRLFAIDIAQQTDIRDDFEIRWTLAQVVNSSRKNGQFLGVAPAFGGLSSEDDVVSDVLLEERRSSASVRALYKGSRHQILGLISVDDLEVTEASQLINLDPLTLLPDSQFNAFPAPVMAGQDRTIYSMVVQDEYRLNDNLTLTAGLRYDDFSDGFDHVSPRLALVTRLNDSNTLKVQYGEAFRPPSLREAGGALTAQLEPETIDTLEFSWIQDKPSLLLRNTVYVSEVREFITFNDSPPLGYQNTEGARLYGYELELNKILSKALSAQANVSLHRSEDKITGDDLFGSTPVIVTLAGEYETFSGTQLNLQFNARSGQQRELIDSRPDTSTTYSLDFAVHKKRFIGEPSLKLSAGIRNVTGQEVRYLAPVNTYPNDYLYAEDPVVWVSIRFSPRQ